MIIRQAQAIDSAIEGCINRADYGLSRSFFGHKLRLRVNSGMRPTAILCTSVVTARSQHY
jgi:hypothetical protein